MTVTALLTNKAYGYPTRGARRRRKPTILACLHQTANAGRHRPGEVRGGAMDSQPGTIWCREPAMVVALVQAVIALVVAFGLNLPPDQIGAILAVTAVILGLITRSRVSPA